MDQENLTQSRPFVDRHRSIKRISRKAAKPQKITQIRRREVSRLPTSEPIRGPQAIDQENLTQSRKVAKNARKKHRTEGFHSRQELSCGSYLSIAPCQLR